MSQPTRYLPLLILPFMLAGCMGGSVGQQLARSLAMQGADHITGMAIEASERAASAPRNIVLKDTEPDPYWAAFLLTQLPVGEPAILVEPLPERPAEPVAQGGRLVRVELWNLIVGQEKHTLLQRSRERGSEIVPPPDEWQRWQVAAGGMQQHTDQPLHILIPPQLGPLRSGDRAIVEISATGGIHVARYRAD